MSNNNIEGQLDDVLDEFIRGYNNDVNQGDINEESNLTSLTPETLMKKKHSEILEKIFEIIINNIDNLLKYLDNANIGNDSLIFDIITTMGLVYTHQKERLVVM